MEIPPLLRKNPFTWDIFLLLFFIIFIVYSPDRFSLFGVKLEIESGMPLLFVFVLFLKVLFSFSLAGSTKAAVFLIVSLIGFALIVLITYIIANRLSHIIEKKVWVPKGLNLEAINTKHIFLFLFLLSFAVRLYYISPGMFHTDTVKLAMAVEKTLETGIIQPAVSKSYGLVILNTIFYTISHYILGATKSILTLNFTSVLFGSLAIPLVFLFTKELFNKFTGIAAALIFSFNPVFLSVSTHGKDHAHAIFFVLLAGWSLLKALETDRNFYKILFGLSLGFSLFIRFPSILALIPFGLIYILKDSKMDKYSVRSMLTVSVPFTIMFILVLYFQYDSILSQKEANLFLSFSSFNVSLLRSFFHAFTAFGLFLSLYGLFRMFQERKKDASIFLVWGLVALLFFSSFVSVALRFFTELYMVAAIFSGYAVFHLRKKYGIVSVIVLLILIISSFLSIHPILVYRKDHATGNELVEYMESITEDDSLIVDYGDYLPYYEYTNSRAAMSCPLTDDQEKLAADIAFISSQQRPVYISQSCFGFGTEEQKQRLLDSLKEKFTLKEVGQIEVDDFHKSEVISDKSTYKIFRLIPNVMQPALGNNLVAEQDS